MGVSSTQFDAGALSATPPSDGFSGLYGACGWSVKLGIWQLLVQGADFAQQTETKTQTNLILDACGYPLKDYTHFYGLNFVQASNLLQLLPAAQLKDRQNLSPTLGAFLRACAQGKGKINLAGYAIGPQRDDERISVEALWMADTDLYALENNDNHDLRCDYGYFWEVVQRRCQLDALAPPDEIATRVRSKVNGELGTWFWWD